jgi:hypothetical protein
MTAKDTFKTIDELAQALQGVGYFAERRLITAVFLSLKLERQSTGQNFGSPSHPFAML